MYWSEFKSGSGRVKEPSCCVALFELPLRSQYRCQRAYQAWEITYQVSPSTRGSEVLLSTKTSCSFGSRFTIDVAVSLSLQSQSATAF
ncbi:unnamed protein product [Cunninghamella echinulata]